MLKATAQGSRRRSGRLLVGADAGAPVWKPSFGKRETVLPDDLRQVGVRPPSVREAMSVNPGSRIVECDSSTGKILIAVMPLELDQVVKALA
ncbi:hypothetical protein [Streptomyces sp. NPDC057854]|uniref:hypothetical protein n=1 Tax=unclassified Streptomyces TaxID=2593676 RepID=UPI0036C7C02D